MKTVHDLRPQGREEGEEMRRWTAYGIANVHIYEGHETETDGYQTWEGQSTGWYVRYEIPNPHASMSWQEGPYATEGAAALAVGA